MDLIYVGYGGKKRWMSNFGGGICFKLMTERMLMLLIEIDVV